MSDAPLTGCPECCTHTYKNGYGALSAKGTVVPTANHRDFKNQREQRQRAHNRSGARQQQSEKDAAQLADKGARQADTTSPSTATHPAAGRCPALAISAQDGALSSFIRRRGVCPVVHPSVSVHGHTTSDRDIVSQKPCAALLHPGYCLIQGSVVFTLWCSTC